MKRKLAMLHGSFVVSLLTGAGAQTNAHARLVPQTGIGLNVTSIECSKDCALVLVSYESSVKLWTLQGQELRTLRANDQTINSAHFSPDGRMILTSGDDGMARLWDAASGKDVLDLKADRTALFSAAFSHDGRYVVTGGQEGAAGIWDAATG